MEMALRLVYVRSSLCLYCAELFADCLGDWYVSSRWLLVSVLVVRL